MRGNWGLESAQRCTHSHHLCRMGQETSGIRINKYLSEVGHCSRRAADKLLEQGRITLNGVVPELGTKVMQPS